MALTPQQYNNLLNALADLCEEAKTYLKTGDQYKATLILRAPLKLGWTNTGATLEADE